jgi:hypothetical protein
MSFLSLRCWSSTGKQKRETKLGDWPQKRHDGRHNPLRMDRPAQMGRHNQSLKRMTMTTTLMFQDGKRRVAGSSTSI